MSAHSCSRPKTSRTTEYARVICATSAPVSSIARCTNVVPLRLIMSLTTTVVMISRCSGWLLKVDAKRSRDRASGSSRRASRWNHGSSGRVLDSMRRISVIFAYATSTAFSGDTQPVALGLALLHLLVRRQELDRAVELAGVLEQLHDTQVHRASAGLSLRAMPSSTFCS